MYVAVDTHIFWGLYISHLNQPINCPIPPLVYVSFYHNIVELVLILDILYRTYVATGQSTIGQLLV
jgi:hypothetical protein